MSCQRAFAGAAASSVFRRTRRRRLSACDAGLGVYGRMPDDYSKAMSCFQRAAGLGLAEGENQIGYLYANGLGVPVDYGEAMVRFRKAAALGFVQAEMNIGTLYLLGRGVAMDRQQARYWISKAAAGGVPAAQRWLAENSD